MNLRDLQYALAVAEHGHFGRAADACNVSQPTLSMQLQKLEGELGVVLFERQRKHVLMTDAARALLPHAQTILQEAQIIRDKARLVRNPLAGEFRLGVFPTLAPYWLPHAMPLLRKALPNIIWFLVEEKTDTLLEQLHRGALDAAILALPLPADEGLASKALFEDPFLLAVYPHHPLAKRKFVDIHILGNEPLLLLEEGHCLRAQALELCSRMGTPEHHEFRATSLETLRHMVAAGVGITLIPNMAANAHDGVVYIPFKSPVPSRRIGVIWREQSARRPCMKLIGDTLHQKIQTRK